MGWKDDSLSPILRAAVYLAHSSLARGRERKSKERDCVQSSSSLENLPWALAVTVVPAFAEMYWFTEFDEFHPSTPKFKKHILPNIYREMYKRCSENLVVRSFFIWISHTVWCNISGEAAGEIWDWSLLGVKVLKKGWWSHLYVESFLITAFAVQERSLLLCCATLPSWSRVCVAQYKKSLNPPQRPNYKAFYGHIRATDRLASSWLVESRCVRFTWSVSCLAACLLGLSVRVTAVIAMQLQNERIKFQGTKALGWSLSLVSSQQSPHIPCGENRISTEQGWGRANSLLNGHNVSISQRNNIRSVNLQHVFGVTSIGQRSSPWTCKLSESRDEISPRVQARAFS